MKRNPRVTVVGIDGGTWKLLKPLMQDGVMPNLARLVEGGASGDLRSTLPPWTPTAWSSFATGKNPGKHGVFGFASQKADGSATWTSSKSVRAASLWHILNQHGLTTGLLNVPMTYPPQEINGFMISGFPSPAA
ncbi:MAG: alkaline phosphatase family protein, partial [Dehalococcoidia bacterium]|nr:alkaline phosphatase family protein [Dehalococcoidia bacterium]